jgi:methyl-accepting chemotaxis protein
MKRFFDWIINNFTYVQIYIFICLLFLISLIPIGYFWVKTHLMHLDLIESQLSELREEKILVDLFTDLQDHRLLTQRYYYKEDKDTLQQIHQMENTISRLIEEIANFSLKQRSALSSETLLWAEIFPREIQKKWKEVLDGFLIVSPRESESNQTILLHDVNILFDYLADRVGISHFNQIDKYVFVQSLFLRVPAFQEALSELILTGDKILANPSKELSRDRARSLIDLIESDISYFERILAAHSTSSHFTDTEHEHASATLLENIKAADQLVKLFREKILNVPTPTISQAEFAKETEKVLPTGISTWQEGLDAMLDIFEVEKSYIRTRLWVVLLTTLFLTGFAFFLGLSLTYTGILRLSELTRATNNFTNGDLSARVPDVYQDEIGKQAKAFNRMAQRLEGLINHLYELIDATSALASGNLSARILLRQDDSEFGRVAISFNKMAETFETIIGRLQNIGIMLTTSASEIASASKEQETIVVEQEATTREIALAAKEISSTAKEFANTMNEVSQTAEQTSNLALRGKDSLNNMESIMSNMVEASTKIAAKLAVLNEKAGNITSVITTITKVADQTNLLSLNASIEAEKAGEYGRSFAVIAREIRRLADQSAIATLDIEKMINEIMTAVSSSVMGVDDFTQEIRKGGEQVRTVSEQLATIIEQVQAFTARFDLVNQGMQAQSTGAEQINEAIAQLSQTARQTSEAIHQFHKTVEELNHAANELSILNPFSGNLEESEQLEESAQIEIPVPNPTSKETKRQIRKTISNLNVAANKLKNLNIQLRPEHLKDKEEKPPSS